jgi:hypothetical protein
MRIAFWGAMCAISVESGFAALGVIAYVLVLLCSIEWRRDGQPLIATCR